MKTRFSFLLFCFVVFSLAYAQPPETLWSHTYGGSRVEYGCAVRQTSDGGFIFAGSTESFGNGHSDVYLVKTDRDGNLSWSRTYGGVGIDNAYAVLQTSDGGFVAAGYTTPNG